jgi:hypothetical protein
MARVGLQQAHDLVECALVFTQSYGRRPAKRVLQQGHIHTRFVSGSPGGAFIGCTDVALIE